MREGYSVVALEGPSDSGKSTLAQAIASIDTWQPAILLPCYVEGVDPATLPPAVATTQQQQLDGLAFFAALDRRRRDTIANHTPAARFVIADRSWLSLLAHVYAAERSGGPAAYSEARRLVTRDENLLQPDLVLVLHARDDVRRTRMSVQDRAAWFTNAAFNAHLDRFFAEEATGLVRCLLPLDANVSPPEMAAAAVSAIVESGCAP